MKHEKKSLWLATLLAGLALITTPAHAQYSGPEAGQKVMFLGDSNTYYGFAPEGWVSLARQALEKNGKKIEAIKAASEGGISTDLVKGLGGVISQKPDWIILSCGVADAREIWPKGNGVPLGPYQKNITAIVDQATKAGIKVVIVTTTVNGEDPANADNQRLAPYNDFLRTLAGQKHLPLVDANADIQSALAKMKAAKPTLKGNLLTMYGSRLNGAGHEIQAAGLLKAFGLADAQIAEAKEAWLDMPGGAPVTVNAAFTIREYLQLCKVASDRAQAIDWVLSGDIDNDVQNHLKSAPPSAPAKP